LANIAYTSTLQTMKSHLFVDISTLAVRCP